MPTISVSIKQLQKMLKKKVKTEDLQEMLLTYLKADSELVGDELMIELIDKNRPDLWGIEGLAREINSLVGIKQKTPVVKKSNVKVIVDSKVKKIRPEIACSIIKGVKLTDELIKNLMQLQDKLDTGYGRKRKKTSIGLYNLDLIKPPIYYKTTKPNNVKFIPLGFEEEMTPAEIMKKHPKGIEYGHIISGYSEFPILIDSKKNILSFPPIINSNNLGKIDETAKNILVEVTGTHWETVLNTLNIVTSAISAYGGTIYSVKSGKNITPAFRGTKHEVKLESIEKVLGLKLDKKQLKKLIEKMSYKLLKFSKDKMVVEAPFYRKDIIHQVDIIEDIAIAYDFNKIPTKMPKIPFAGRLLPETQKINNLREIMIGMGKQEILNFTLTSRENIFEKTLQKNKKVAEIQNPVSSSYDILREELFPGILEFLAKNKTMEFPQKIFEIGDVIIPNSKQENGVEQKTNLCAAITHPKAGFTEIKSVLDNLMFNLNKEIKLQQKMHPSFIDGRCGAVLLDGKEIGVIGEIHPQVLENFGFENPVVLFEINVDIL